MICLLDIICGEVARILLAHDSLISHVFQGFAPFFFKYGIADKRRFRHIAGITVQIMLRQGTAIVLDLEVEDLRALLFEVMDGEQVIDDLETNLSHLGDLNLVLVLVDELGVQLKHVDLSLGGIGMEQYYFVVYGCEEDLVE